MIVVVDYDVGNVKSVCNAFEYIGCDVKLSSDTADIKNSSGLVLPGVAAFGFAMNALGETADLLKEVVQNGKALLGICVGYQMLFEKSCEYGHHNGLGLISGDVVALPLGKTVPHMGWNEVELPEDMDLFAGLGDKKHFYFAHSFYPDIKDKKAKIAYSEYGFELPAAVQKDNIYGVQFHPEKSSNNGLKILQNFYEICEKGKS